jgi:hypothetical protein
MNTQNDILQDWEQLGKIEDVGIIVEGGGIDRFWKREDVQLFTEYFTGVNKTFQVKWLHDANKALEHFNLRSIEFGNWMNQEDRANFLYASMLGLHQLALIFGVPDNEIGLSGKLSIALGARGRGRASGHYESNPFSVINITKTQGIGVLAHEYAHAMDNILSFHTKSKQTFVSGGRTTRKGFDKDIAKNGNYFEKQFEEFFDLMYYDAEENETDFLEEIKKKDEYWQRRNEVFARTMEVYISDKQKKKKHPNHFLAPTGFGKAYPSLKLVNNVSRIIENIFSKGFQVMRENNLNGLGSLSMVTGYKGFTKTLKENANLDDTLKNMQRIAKRDVNQVRELALHLKKSTVESTANNIWDYLRANTKYKFDRQGFEELRTPSRSLVDGKAGLIDDDFGIDCDDYTILISALLLNLGIDHEYRVAAYQEKGKFQHIYPVAFDKQGNEFVIDVVPEIPHFNYEEKPIIDLKKIPMELQELSGVDAITEEEIKSDLAEELNQPFVLSGIEDDLEDEILESGFLSGFGEVATEEEADIVLSGADDVLEIIERGLLAEVHKAKATLVEEKQQPTALSQLVNVSQELQNINNVIDAWSDEDERDAALSTAVQKGSAYANFYRALQLSLVQLEEEDEELSGLEDDPIFLAKMDISEYELDDILDEDGVVEDVLHEGVDGFFSKLKKKFKPRRFFKKIFTKVKKGLKKVVKAVVRFNPATIAMRAAILLTLKTNGFNIASRIIYGFLTQSQAEANNLDIAEWRKVVDAKNKAQGFFTKIGGKSHNFRKAVVKGKAAKKTGLRLNGLAAADGKSSKGFIKFVGKLLSKINVFKLFKKRKKKPSSTPSSLIRTANNNASTPSNDFVDEGDFNSTDFPSQQRTANNQNTNPDGSKKGIFKRMMTKTFWKDEVWANHKGKIAIGSVSIGLLVFVLLVARFRKSQKRKSSALKGARTRKRNQKKQLALGSPKRRSTPKRKAAPRKPTARKGQLKGSTTIVKHATKGTGKGAKVSTMSNSERLSRMHDKAQQLKKKHPNTKYSKLLSKASKLI